MSTLSVDPSAVVAHSAAPAWLRLVRRHLLFLVAVVVPAIASALYYGVIASDVYLSEARFVVRTPQKAPPAGIGALLQTAGIARAQDESYSIGDFMLSRDALQALERELTLSALWGGDTVDRISRFGGLDLDTSFENLHRYYGRRVSTVLDSASGITTLRVTSFDPASAQQVNRRLLEMAEGMVNRINERAREDLLRFATAEVGQAQDRARAAAQALSDYRGRTAVVDPEKQAGVQLGQVLKLQDELTATQMQLAQLQTLAPQNPQIEPLHRRVRMLQAEIGAQNARVTGGERSLVGKAPDFQRLLLDREFADRQLAAAMATLEQARNDAQRQQLYLERIVQPSRADAPAEPRRLRAFLATLALSLVAWGVLALLVAGVREHRD